MQLKLGLPLAATLAAGLTSLPASAAPLVSGGLGEAAKEQSVITTVHRGCYRHRGHWHCPRYVRRYYRYYDEPRYGYYRPYYGYGPSFGLYFGGGRGWGGRW